MRENDIYTFILSIIYISKCYTNKFILSFFLFLNDFFKYLFTLIVHVHDSYIIMHWAKYNNEDFEKIQWITELDISYIFLLHYQELA